MQKQHENMIKSKLINKYSFINLDDNILYETLRHPSDGLFGLMSKVGSFVIVVETKMLRKLILVNWSIRNFNEATRRD